MSKTELQRNQMNIFISFIARMSAQIDYNRNIMPMPSALVDSWDTLYEQMEQKLDAVIREYSIANGIQVYMDDNGEEQS